ncbi:MAG: type II toxin-antitoxin system RelE/ParE family toxin [bacterium]|nr:type II toxin-antitoxin system RelE/ParE family toxin [bacterium]
MPRRYEIFWTGPALADLRPIRDYVAAEGRPEAAKRLAGKIRDAVLRLRDHPHSGRPVPEVPDGRYREVIVTPYRIVCELAGDKVVLLRVWHGRRDLTRLER